MHFFQSHDVVAHEVYGEDAVRVTPPPPLPPLQSSNTSCLMNPQTTSLPPSQTSTLMHGRSSSQAAMMQKSNESIETSLGPNGDAIMHGYHSDLIPVSFLQVGPDLKRLPKFLDYSKCTNPEEKLTSIEVNVSLRLLHLSGVLAIPPVTIWRT